MDEEKRLIYFVNFLINPFYGTDVPAVFTGMSPFPDRMNSLSEAATHNHFGHGIPMLTPIFMISS